jgi:hypothetical protein
MTTVLIKQCPQRYFAARIGRDTDITLPALPA